MKSRENAAGEACFFTITTAVLAGLCLAVAPTEVRAMQDEDVLENRTSLAWMRFDDDGRQEYKGVRYRWLGDGDITLHVDVAPDPSHVFAFRWGAKNDQRDAALRICGEKIDLHHGGYEGFRWFIVPVPKKAKGSAYTLHLVAGSRSPAFFAEIRLLAPGDVGSVALSRRSHRMTAKFGIRTRPHPFPERRARWEAEVSRRPGTSDTVEERRFLRAATNGVRANEQFFRCRRFVDGWLRHADRKTGLIPRNLGRDKGIWNAQDAAADNYPFMVLTCALTDRPMFEGRMLDMLRTETRLTSRLGRLPDTWSFAKQAFQSEKPDLSGIIFGGSEYVKDGLLPLTEWLGPSPWSERMLGIVDDLWKHAPIETPYGRIPSTNVEVNGEMLQALSRIYWMTGEARFFEYAKRLGDYYLLGDHHPTRDFSSLRLRDHGCEIVSGLSELYAAVHFADPKRKKAYREPIHAIFDRILEIGRNEHGLLYNTINPRAGTTGRGLCDTWGYNYNGVYTVYLLDGTETYRDAVRKVLGNLNAHYKDFAWGGRSVLADEYADSIEGALNLFNREPIPSAAAWLDTEIRNMWAHQTTDGVVEGWHGDGNSARTSIMYALWKTRGVTARPWRDDLYYGATEADGLLYLSVVADRAWKGKLLFDRQRHRDVLHLRLDYPRINQFPEWFTVESGKRYEVREPTGGPPRTYTGAQLLEGVEVELDPGVERRWIVAPARD